MPALRRQYDHRPSAHPATCPKTILVKREDLSVQELSLAQAMKPVKLGQISLDDAENTANAFKHQALLQKAAETDRAVEQDNFDLPG